MSDHLSELPVPFVFFQGKFIQEEVSEAKKWRGLIIFYTSHRFDPN